MRTIGAVFCTRADALDALRALSELDVGHTTLGILTPGRDRTSLGEAAIAGVIPGVGPAIGVGALGALLAVTTPTTSERGFTADEVDTFHEAVRRGCSVVLVLIHEERHEHSARKSLLRVGRAVDDARRRWEDEAQAFALASAVLRPSLY